MEMDKEEQKEELDHQKGMVRDLRRRRRVLQRQLAHQGYQAPPHIITEVDDITNKIRTYEEEIAKLQTLVVEDKLSAPEADYRVFLADVFNTPSGLPSVVGNVRLEQERLRLGL